MLKSQSYGFSSSHVRMWELSHQEAEQWRTDTSRLWCEGGRPEPLGQQGGQNQSTPEEINTEYSLEGLMLELQYSAHLMQRADSPEKTLMLGKTEGRRRKGWQRIGQHHRLSGHELEQTPGDSEGGRRTASVYKPGTDTPCTASSALQPAPWGHASWSKGGRWGQQIPWPPEAPSPCAPPSIPQEGWGRLPSFQHQCLEIRHAPKLAHNPSPEPRNPRSSDNMFTTRLGMVSAPLTWNSHTPAAKLLLPDDKVLTA